jgi:hypothetical protein
MTTTTSALATTTSEALLLAGVVSDRTEALRAANCLAQAGYELRTSELTGEQRARVEALRCARRIVEGRPTSPGAALTPLQTSELVPLARYILTGTEFPDPAPPMLADSEQRDFEQRLRTPEGLRRAMQDAAAAR